MSIESILSSFSMLIYFLIVIGLAVVFHEWGHFIVAKLCGAKVKDFAVGMGPKLFSYNWHDTEYSVCALPIGGYVNIAGMSPEDELTGESWEYLQLAPWKRILIVFAGPFMNFVLAILLYMILLTAYGESYTATKVIGKVPEGSWGWMMGLQEGDEIVSVNGIEVGSWDDVVINQAAFQNNAITVTVNRNGEILNREKALPAYMLSDEPVETVQPEKNFDGIFITGVLSGSAAEKAGLQPGDNVIEAGGNTFTYREEWSDFLSTRFEKKDDGTYVPANVEIKYIDPKGETKTTILEPDLEYPVDDAVPYQPISKIGVTYQGEVSPKEFFKQQYTVEPLGVAPKMAPVVGGLQAGAPAEIAGIKRGSRIVEVDGKPVDNWIDIKLMTQDAIEVDANGDATAKPMEITWYTPDEEMKTALITPKIVKSALYTQRSLSTGKQYNIAQLGFDQRVDRKKLGIVGAAVGAWERTYNICNRMIDIIYRLFTAEISIKVMGGPIAIFQMSGEHGTWGMEMFLGFIAMLSINLGLINLFPLPPLDGGHIVFYLYEIVRRKTITMSQMENFGKIGFIVIIPLMLFMVFNDLARTGFFSMIGKFFKSVAGS